MTTAPQTAPGASLASDLGIVGQIRATFIQAVCDNGFSKAAVKSLPKYRITDSVTARMWLRDAAVWSYNLRAVDRERLRRQQIITGGAR